MIAISEEFAAPGDYLNNAAFAHHLIGHYQAVELQQLVDFVRAHPVGEEFAYLDVATALHITDRAAQRRIRFACSLIERLPQTLEALRQGWIEEYKAELIARAVEPLSNEHALAVEARVLDQAHQQTPRQLQNTLARVVIAVDPEGAEERRQEKVRERRVEYFPTEDGQAMLALHHGAEKIASAHAVISARARELKRLGGETRTLEQLEADVACDLILGTDTGSRRVVEVHLTLPVTTALGLDERPGEVDGVPVTAQAARELVAEASRWRWIRTDPQTGAVVDLTYPQYSPPAALATFIKVRDRTCRYPGCTRDAWRCDIDHRVSWPRGATCDANCACLCRRHHRAKHEGGWQLEAIKPGWFTWISPVGHTHTVEPERVTAPAPMEADLPPF